MNSVKLNILSALGVAAAAGGFFLYMHLFTTYVNPSADVAFVNLFMVFAGVTVLTGLHELIKLLITDYIEKRGEENDNT